MFGRAVGAGGLGFGVVRDEHASAILNKVDANKTKTVQGGGDLYLKLSSSRLRPENLARKR